MKELVTAPLLTALVTAALAGSALAYDTVQYWGHAGTPVSNYWNDDSNWPLGIPTSTHHARIRSEGETEEHVTVQSGNSAMCDWLTVGGRIWYVEDSPTPCLDASLTVEAGAALYFNCDEEQYGKLEIGTGYTGTVHSCGTIDGWEMWPLKNSLPNPGWIGTPAIMIGHEWNESLPDGGKGYMFCYDGSYSRTGMTRLCDEPGSQGWLYIHEGASYESNFSVEVGHQDAAVLKDSYGQVNLLGGTLDIEDTWNPPLDKIPANMPVGMPDTMVTTGGKGELNLQSGVLYVDGDIAILKGTANIGKDVDATVNRDYLIRPATWTDASGSVYEAHPNANDFLTTVEIDIHPLSSTVTNSQVVVGGNTHMDGNLFIHNSGDRPKEGDQFTLWNGETGSGQTHDGSFLSVTTNLTGGNAGYSSYYDAGAGDRIVEFTGLTGGDANADHKISIGDLSIMAGNWNQCGFTNGYADADFNGDGCVKIGDLSIMAGNWGWGRPAGWYVPMADQETGGFDYIQILMCPPDQFDSPAMSAFFGLDSEDNLVPAGEQWGQMFLNDERDFAWASGPNLGEDILVFAIWIDGDRQIDLPTFHYQTYREGNLVGNWDIICIGPGELDWIVDLGTWTADSPLLSGSQVPEPGAIVLLSIGALALMRRRGGK